MCDILSSKRQKITPEKLNVFGGYLAHLSGFEPETFRLGGGRSILLSYKCSLVIFSTIDRSLRRRTLYPAELQVHIRFFVSNRQSA